MLLTFGSDDHHEQWILSQRFFNRFVMHVLSPHDDICIIYMARPVAFQHRFRTVGFVPRSAPLPERLRNRTPSSPAPASFPESASFLGRLRYPCGFVTPGHLSSQAGFVPRADFDPWSASFPGSVSLPRSYSIPRFNSCPNPGTAFSGSSR